MSINKDNSELLISDTLVPDIFLTQYIQELSKNAICLYMWLLMILGNDKFTENDLKEYQVITKAERSEAFAELISQDLVIKDKNNKYQLADLKKREVEEYCKTMNAKGDSLDGVSLSSDNSRDVLASSINKTFYLGKMAALNYRLIDKCLYEYGFDSAVIYTLFEEARREKQLYRINFLQKVAEDWYKKGYTTPDKLTTMIANKNKTEEIVKSLGKLMRKRLDGLDIEKIETWVTEYDVSVELVEYAYRCNDFRSTITLRNVGDKLKEWYLSDITTIDKAAVYENKKHEENKSKVSRKKASGNPWKLGGEMGVGSSETKTESSKKAEEAVTSDSDVEEDEILNLFGGSDADN